jgi:hypothetical protein
MHINLRFQHPHCMGWSPTLLHVYEPRLPAKKMVDGRLDPWMVCERLTVCVCALIWFLIQIPPPTLSICASAEPTPSAHHRAPRRACLDRIDHNLVSAIRRVRIKNSHRPFKASCQTVSACQRRRAPQVVASCSRAIHGALGVELP